MTTTTLRSGAALVVSMMSGSRLPPDDDRIAGEGRYQCCQGDGEEGALAYGVSGYELERPERVERSDGVEGPAPSSRRSDGPVLGSDVHHGRPVIVKSHAKRGQGAREVCQVTAPPGQTG